MKPEQKAKELIESFAEAVPSIVIWNDRGSSNTMLEERDWKIAKQCAIISVGQIMEVLNQISYMESGTTFIDYGQTYWESVKNEITKL
jgi:hypothetical protein